MLLSAAQQIDEALASNGIYGCLFDDNLSLKDNILNPLRSFAESLIDGNDASSAQCLENLLPVLNNQGEHVQKWTRCTKHKLNQLIARLDRMRGTLTVDSPVRDGEKPKIMNKQRLLQEMGSYLTSEQMDSLKSTELRKHLVAFAPQRKGSSKKRVPAPMLLALKVLKHVALFEDQKKELLQDCDNIGSSERSHTRGSQARLFLPNGTTVFSNVTLSQSDLQQCGLCESISLENVSVYYQGDGETCFVGYNESEIVSFTEPANGSSVISKFGVPESYHPVYVGHGQFHSMGLVLLFSESKQSYGLCVVELNQGVPMFQVLYFDASFEQSLSCVYDTDDSGFCVAFHDSKLAQCFKRVEGKLVPTGCRRPSSFCQNKEWWSFVSGYDVCMLHQKLFKVQFDFLIHQLAQYSNKLTICFMELCAYCQAQGCVTLESFPEVHKIFDFLDCVCSDYSPVLAGILTVCSVWLGLNMPVWASVNKDDQKETSNTEEESALKALLVFYERVMTLAPEAHDAVLFGLAVQSENLVRVDKAKYVTLVESLIRQGNVHCSLPIFALSVGITSLTNYDAYFDLLSKNCPMDLAVDAITKRLYVTVCDTQTENIRAFQTAAFQWITFHVRQGEQLQSSLEPFFLLAERDETLLWELMNIHIPRRYEADESYYQGTALSQSDLSLLCYILALNKGVLKFPEDKDEQVSEDALDSDLFKIQAKIDESGGVELIQRTPSEVELSFPPKRESNHYDRAMMQEFLNDLVDSSENSQLVKAFEGFLIKKMKEPTERLLGDSLKRMRRLTAAVLMKYLGATESALQLAFCVSSGDMSVPISSVVRLAWDESNRFVREMKYKSQMGSSLDDIITGYQEKLEFLLAKEPAVQISTPDRVMDNSRKAIVSNIFRFVKCSRSVSDIEAILKNRAYRCMAYQKPLEHVTSLMGCLSPVHFAFLQGSVQTYMDKIMTHPEFGSLDDDMVLPVKGCLTKYMRSALHQICHNDFADRAAVQVIQYAPCDFISEEDGCSFIIDALSAIPKRPETSKVILWHFVIRMALKHPKNVVEILEKGLSLFTTQEDREICGFLQAVILQNSKVIEWRPQNGTSNWTESALLKTFVLASKCWDQCKLETFMVDFVSRLLQMIGGENEQEMIFGHKMWQVLMKYPAKSALVDIGKRHILRKEYGDRDILSVFMAFVGSKHVTLSGNPVIDPNEWTLDSDVLSALTCLCGRAVPDKFGDYLLQFCSWLACNEENRILMSKSNMTDVLNKNTQISYTEVPSLWCYEDWTHVVPSKGDDIWTSQRLTSEAISLKARYPHVWELHGHRRGDIWLEVTFVTDVPFFEIGYVICGDSMPFYGVEVVKEDEKAEIRVSNSVSYPFESPIGLQGQQYIFGVTKRHFIVVDKDSGAYYKLEHFCQFGCAIPVVAVLNRALDGIEVTVVPVNSRDVYLGRPMRTEAICLGNDLSPDLSEVSNPSDSSLDVDIWIPPGSTCLIDGEEWTVNRWLVEGESIRYELCRGSMVRTTSKQSSPLDLVQNIRFLNQYVHSCSIYKQVRYLKLLLGLNAGTELALLELTSICNPYKAITRSSRETEMCEFLKMIWNTQINKSEFLTFVDKTLAKGCKPISNGQTTKILVESPGMGHRHFIWRDCQYCGFSDRKCHARQEITLPISTNSFVEYETSNGERSVVAMPIFHRAHFASTSGLRIVGKTIAKLAPGSISDTTITAICAAKIVIPRLVSRIISRQLNNFESLRDSVVVSQLHRMKTRTAQWILVDVARLVTRSCRRSTGPCLCRHLTSLLEHCKADLREYVTDVQKILAVGNPEEFCLGCFDSDVRSVLKQLHGSEDLSPELLCTLHEAMTKEVIDTVQIALEADEPHEAIAETLSKKYRIERHIGACIVLIIKTNNSCCLSIFKRIRGDKGLHSKLTQEQIVYPLGYKRSFTLNNVKCMKYTNYITIDKLERSCGIMSLFSQLQRQVPLSQVENLRTSSHLPWNVSYVREIGSDAGGLARDFFTLVCEEVLQPEAGLFQQTPNGRNGKGPNQTALIPSVTADPNDLEYVGVLMALAYWCQLPQQFEFPDLVWKYLTTSKIEVQDLCEIDMQFSQLMSMDSIQPEIMLVDIWGRPRNGECLASTVPRQTVMAWITDQITALTGVLEPLARGIRRIIPNGFGLYRPLELKMEICGPDRCPMSRLINVVQVSPSTSTKLVHAALESLTDEERFGFLQFITGSRGFSAVRINVNKERGLPVAQTCFRTLSIREYLTPCQLAKDIRVCLEWGGDFGLA